MRIIFATHFDEVYFPQAAAMVESLLLHCPDATILAMPLTDDCYSLVCSRLPGVQRMAMNSLHPGILSLINKRTWKEFCWTLEPALIAAMLQYAQGDECIVYVDADQFFFSDPIPDIMDAMESADVALTPHHFPDCQKHKEKSVGKFNFGIGAFRVCEATRNLVRDWLEKTLHQCGEATAGHQRYLDQWPDIFGDRFGYLPMSINIGPWSLPHVLLNHRDDGTPVPVLRDYDDLHEVVSFHFHEFRRGTGRNPITLNGQAWNRTNYDLHPATVENVYKVYERALLKWL